MWFDEVKTETRHVLPRGLALTVIVGQLCSTALGEPMLTTQFALDMARAYSQHCSSNARALCGLNVRNAPELEPSHAPLRVVGILSVTPIDSFLAPLIVTMILSLTNGTAGPRLAARARGDNATFNVAITAMITFSERLNLLVIRPFLPGDRRHVNLTLL